MSAGTNSDVPHDRFDSVSSVSSLEQSDSAELIDRARNGCDEALNELIRSLHGYLLMIADQELNANLRAKIGPSDLVQSVLARVDGNLAEFRGTSRQTLLAWLRKILRNEIKSAHRRYVQSDKRNLRREQLSMPDGRELLPVADNSPSPRTEAILQEEGALLRQAMRRLPRDYRTVVGMRNWERLSFDEIGLRMNRSTGAAKKLWARAIRQLRRELKNEGPQETS